MVLHVRDRCKTFLVSLDALLSFGLRSFGPLGPLGPLLRFAATVRVLGTLRLRRLLRSGFLRGRLLLVRRLLLLGCLLLRPRLLLSSLGRLAGSPLSTTPRAPLQLCNRNWKLDTVYSMKEVALSHSGVLVLIDNQRSVNIFGRCCRNSHAQCQKARRKNARLVKTHLGHQAPDLE